MFDAQATTTGDMRLPLHLTHVFLTPPLHLPTRSVDATQVWAELEGPKCPTIQEACTAAASGSAGVQTFLAGMDKAGRTAGHERRVARVLDGLPAGVMVFVVSQGVNPELPRKLDKQRKACEDRRCASVWSPGQGRLLEALESRARDGCVFVAVT